MLHERESEALNEHLNAELYSGYLYLSMSTYFESINLPGFAQWMRVQAQEELMHAVKFIDYIQERGGRVHLAPVAGPQTGWESALAVFEHGYEHEIGVSGRINRLVDLAIEVSDHATNNFLQWFVAEQVEEESSFDEVVQRLRLAGSDGSALFLLDREMASRVAAPPADSR